MSEEAKQKYLETTAQLDKLEAVCGYYGPEQDDLTDQLDRLWWEMTDEEQAQVEQELK